MKNPKTIYKGKLLHLVTGRKTLPHGRVMHLERINHPGASLIVPFLTKNKIIMLKQYRAAIDAYMYELPAGTLEKNEKPHVCARREVVEETGFRARKITKLGIVYPVPGYSTEIIYMYKAEDLEEAECNYDVDEVIETCVMTKTEVKKLFKSGKLVDAKTICALTYCGWL